MTEGFKFRVSKGLGVKEGFRRPVRAPACQCATVEGVSTRPHSTPGLGKKGGGGDLCTCHGQTLSQYASQKQKKTGKNRKEKKIYKEENWKFDRKNRENIKR